MRASQPAQLPYHVRTRFQEVTPQTPPTMPTEESHFQPELE